MTTPTVDRVAYALELARNIEGTAVPRWVPLPPGSCTSLSVTAASTVTGAGTTRQRYTVEHQQTAGRVGRGWLPRANPNEP